MPMEFIVRKVTKGSGILAFLLIGAVTPGLSARAPGLRTQDKHEHSGQKSSKATIVDAREGHATLLKEGITVENARWMGSMLGRLSEKQIGDAFRGAGFDDSQVATYVRAMRERIGELQNLK